MAARLQPQAVLTAPHRDFDSDKLRAHDVPARGWAIASRALRKMGDQRMHGQRGRKDGVD